MIKLDEYTYEAVYLDFLEGNLSESETRMFMQFLEANPNLRIADELLGDIKLFPPKNQLDVLFKEELTFYSDTDEINDQSIHHFLIAELEGCLSDSKREELHGFMQTNPKYNKVKNEFASTRILIDEKIVFEEKQSLKKRTYFSLSNFIGYAAACVLISIFLLKGKNVDKELSIVHKEKQAVFKQTHNPQQLQDDFPIINDVDTPKKSPQVAIPDDVLKTAYLQPYLELTPKEMAFLPVRTDSNVIELQRKMEVKSETDQAHQLTKLEALFGSAKNYKNPIKPITSLVSVILKKNIDVRMSKQTLKQSDYLFIKIGRLQVYRQKRTENSEGLICFRYDE